MDRDVRYALMYGLSAETIWKGLGMTKGYVCSRCGSQVIGHSKQKCDIGNAILIAANLKETKILNDERNDRWVEVMDALHKLPIDMLLFCPQCNTQHVDAPLGAWTNPPHRTHTCQYCGHEWRPSDWETNGVATIKTVGKQDKSPIPAACFRWRTPAVGQELIEGRVSNELAERWKIEEDDVKE